MIHFRTAIVCTALLAGSLATGCSRNNAGGLPPGIQGGTPSRYDAIVQRMDREGERNWVLHLYTLAVVALREGDRATAKRALDEAMLQIEVIYGDSPEARRARSLWHEEGRKIFKGDPYERAMVYFVRGVLYMQDRQWDNARACFRSAILQDAFAEEEEYRGDWVLFDYLIGVCELQMGNQAAAERAFELAERNYAQLRERYPQLHAVGPGNARPAPIRFAGDLQPFPPSANLLVLGQLGRPPIKVGEGRYRQYLGYRAGGTRDSLGLVSINGTPVGPVQITDSTLYQALTRGSREMDRILGRQARTRGTTTDVGTGAAYGGGWLLLSGLDLRDRNLALIGLGIAAVGAVAIAVASLIQPQADTRQMYYIPELLGFTAARLAPGEHEVSMTYATGRGGSALYTAAADVSVSSEPGELAVVLFFPPPEPFAAGEPAPAPERPVARRNTPSPEVNR